MIPESVPGLWIATWKFFEPGDPDGGIEKTAWSVPVQLHDHVVVIIYGIDIVGVGERLVLLRDRAARLGPGTIASREDLLHHVDSTHRQPVEEVAVPVVVPLGRTFISGEGEFRSGGGVVARIPVIRIVQEDPEIPFRRVKPTARRLLGGTVIGGIPVGKIRHAPRVADQQGHAGEDGLDDVWGVLAILLEGRRLRPSSGEGEDRAREKH
jgi:hypothetical protein